MGTIKADTVTGLAAPNKATIPNTITMGSTTATLNFGNTAIANASAGSTTITGEGGSNTTNIQQGLCKSFLHYNHSGDSVLDSFNISSVTDNATGHFTQNYTTNMNSATYSRTAAAAETGGTGPGSDRYCGPARGSSRKNTSNAEFVAGDVSDQMGTLRDQGDYSTAVFGDLA